MSIAKNILRISAVDGTVRRAGNTLAFTHHIAIATDAPATGTLKIEAKPPGSATFEAIPGAEALDLAALESIQVLGLMEEFELTLTNVTGATELTITDSCETL